MMAFTLVGAGQDDEAQALAPRLVQSDPLSAATWMAAGGPLWFVGRADQGIPVMKRDSKSIRTTSLRTGARDTHARLPDSSTKRRAHGAASGGSLAACRTRGSSWR